MRSIALGLAALLTACGFSGARPEIPPQCGFPEDTTLAFAGTSSFAELRVDRLDDTRGYVVVTDERIPPPMTPSGRPMRGAPDFGRYACIVWPDENLGVQLVPDDWQPPF